MGRSIFEGLPLSVDGKQPPACMENGCEGDDDIYRCFYQQDEI